MRGLTNPSPIDIIISNQSNNEVIGDHQMATSTLYLSNGDTNGFYTLRCSTWSAGFGRNTDDFWGNLSTDWDTAFEKATEMAVSYSYLLGTKYDERWELNEWGTGGTTGETQRRYYSWLPIVQNGLVPFGKHFGTPIAELPAGYRQWIRSVNDGTRHWAMLIKALESTLEADEAADKAAQEAREAKNAMSQWVGCIGEKKVTATVTCTKKIEFDGYYGPGCISVLEDEHGNVLKTFGKCMIDKDETAKITFTVKDHGEYKGQKDTVIKMVKIIS